MLAVYEQARKYCLAHYEDEKRVFIEVTKLPSDVVDIQLKERTDLTYNRIGPQQRDTILQAGLGAAEGRRDSGQCRCEKGARRSGRRSVCGRVAVVARRTITGIVRCAPLDSSSLAPQ